MPLLQAIRAEEQSHVVEEQIGREPSARPAQVEGTESRRMESVGRMGMPIEEERGTRSSARRTDPRLADAEQSAKKALLEFPEEPELA